MGNGFLPHSASLQRNRLFFLKLWHLPLLILFQKVSMMRQLLFATSSFSCGQENIVTKPHIQKHWTEEEIYSSFHWVVQQTAHRGDGGTHCRQSNKTMIWATRSSAPTTEGSDAKRLLTYLNCYPAHERAATFPCTNLTVKDNITDHFPSKPTWTASNSQLFLAEVPSASSLHEHTQMHSASLGENQAWQNAF